MLSALRGAKSGRGHPRRHEAAVAAPHACGTALVRGDRSDRSPAGFVHVGKGLIDDRHSLTMAAGRTLLGEGLSDLFGWFREEL